MQKPNRPNIRIPRPLCPPARRRRGGPLQPAIQVHPAPQFIEEGQPATFAVIATGYPPEQMAELKYEWQFNTAPKVKQAKGHKFNLDDPDDRCAERVFLDQGFKPYENAQSASTLTIPKVSKNTVAFYRVKVTGPNGKVAVSKPAQLWVWKETNSIIVWGPLVTESGGGSGSPGAYQKRVDYDLGFWPLGTPRQATDQQRTDTWIEWFDWYYVGGIGSGGQVTVTVQHPSAPHYFTIYIPAGGSSPTPYSIHLQNFY